MYLPPKSPAQAPARRKTTARRCETGGCTCSTDSVACYTIAVARVLLLDTHALFFRAFYALPPMNTRAGLPTSALYGLCVMLLKLLREERPLGLVFALDGPRPTFRHVQSPGYKAQRGAVPDPLRQQLSILPRVLEACQVPCFNAEGFEADDVLATLAARLSAEHALRIVTGDRDLFQVIGPKVDVMFVGARGQKPVIYDEAAITRRYQLRPEQLPSRTALVGDPSDNLPKVPGVGERTAETLVRRFGDMHGLLAQLEQVEPLKLRAALAAARAQLLETEELARLRVDVPLPEPPYFAAMSGEGLASLRALCKELEFTSLLPRIDKLISSALQVGFSAR
jgi:DNA polymerase-1